ncbi:MAG TPA: PAS domain-containing protein [Rhizomicrobium sp.]|nr:PAS domain-containing protein [Rhizomicrobium sp.]
MKHRNCHLLIGYWSRLRAGRDVPDQSEIDPRAIKRMLSQVFILDARDAARPFYRLAGTMLCDRFGLELRGTSFFAHWEAQARDRLVLLLRQSLQMKLPVWLSAIGTTANCAMIEMETVLAPLTSGPGAPQRFLGIVQFLGDFSQSGGRAIAYERLIESRMICEHEPLDQPQDPPPPPPCDSHHAARPPHLRLVISRDGPAPLQCDIDDPMRSLLAALEISRPAGQVR